MSIDKFKEIPNDFRETAASYRPRKENPIVTQLLEDKTLFIDESEVPNEGQLNKFYETARSLGFQLHKRKTVIDDVKGFVLWFTKVEAK